MKFIKANWKIIVGVIFALGAIGSGESGTIVFGLVVGAAFIFWWYKSRGKAAPDPARAASPARREEKEQFDTYTRKFKVVGVTFENEDGTSRQDILKRIYQKKPPFDGDLDVTLKEYVFEDGPAFGVFVNGQMVGNTPSDNTDFLNRAKERGVKVVDFKVDRFKPDDEPERGYVYYARLVAEIVKAK